MHDIVHFCDLTLQHYFFKLLFHKSILVDDGIFFFLKYVSSCLTDYFGGFLCFLIVFLDFFSLFFELTRSEDSEESLFNDNIRLVVLLNQSHDLLQVRELLVELALEFPGEPPRRQLELKVKNIKTV